LKDPGMPGSSFGGLEVSRVQGFKGGVDLADRDFAAISIYESQMDYTGGQDGRLEGWKVGGKVERWKSETR